MSRGPGRCQRAVLVRLEASEVGVMGLDELVGALEERRFRSHNVYRAIRGLRRVHAVGVSERGPGRAGTCVSLPQPAPNPLSDAEVQRLIDEAGRAESAAQPKASETSARVRTP